jgi:hypothetical protein
MGLLETFIETKKRHKGHENSVENDEGKRERNSPFSQIHWLDLLSGKTKSGDDVNEVA